MHLSSQRSPPERRRPTNGGEALLESQAVRTRLDRRKPPPTMPKPTINVSQVVGSGTEPTGGGGTTGLSTPGVVPVLPPLVPGTPPGPGTKPGKPPISGKITT